MRVKLCYTCKKIKPIDEFNKNKKAKDGLQYNCKLCRIVLRSSPEKKQETAKRSKRHYESHKDRYKNRNLKKLYGLTLEEYNKKLEEQDYCCSICYTILDGKIPNTIPCIDHCHKTKKVRSLLCGNCNKLLGYAKENINILQEAIKYINKWTKKENGVSSI